MAAVDMSPSCACIVCGERALEEFVEFGDLSRVTSDCKPFVPGGRLAVCNNCGAVQKPTDAHWTQEIEGIYQNYAAYFQSDGVEQAVFDQGSGTQSLRSVTIIERLKDLVPLAKDGSVLDIGSGSGVLLSAFSKVFQDWALYGQDLSTINEPDLKRIAGFEELFTCPLAELPRSFDLITMIHSLEHFADPHEALESIKPALGQSGRLMIQVPNAEVTPFDLLVADHASHFTKRDLTHLLARAGYETTIVTDAWVAKELSVVAAPATQVSVQTVPDSDVAKTKERVAAQLAWLRSVVLSVSEAARSGRKLGVFGTSVAAMWLVGQFGDAVSFFVDEDKNRQDTDLLGRPVYHPDHVPADTVVFVALIPEIASKVAERLSPKAYDLITPPELGA